MKVKEIYITQDKKNGQSDYATGVYYVLENGDVYEAMSTDVLQHLQQSRVRVEDLQD
jgi:hypothetical protein